MIDTIRSRHIDGILIEKGFKKRISENEVVYFTKVYRKDILGKPIKLVISPSLRYKRCTIKTNIFEDTSISSDNEIFSKFLSDIELVNHIFNERKWYYWIIKMKFKHI